MPAPLGRCCRWALLSALTASTTALTLDQTPLFALSSAAADAGLTRQQPQQSAAAGGAGAGAGAWPSISVPLATPPLHILGLSPPRGIFDPSMLATGNSTIPYVMTVSAVQATDNISTIVRNAAPSADACSQGDF